MRQFLHFWPYAAFLGVSVCALTLDHSPPAAEGSFAEPSIELPPPPNSDDLERRLLACHARVRARQRIVQELIDGRITLLDAAERFRDISETSAEFRFEQFRTVFSGPTDDVRHCRYVIARIREGLPGEPQRAAVVTERYQKELDDLLQRGWCSLEQRTGEGGR